MPIRPSVAAALAASLLAAPAASQATLTTSAAVGSGYITRGLTYSNRPVVQADAALAVPLGGGALTGGVLASFEPARYDAADAISMNGAAPASLTEVDAWAEYGRALGRVTLTGGALAFRFPNDAGMPRALNTVEVYARAAAAVPLSPVVTVYRDVDKVRGTYAEGSASHTFALRPGASLVLGALAGYSRGEGPRPGENANFARDGVTHLDLWASAPLARGSFTVAPVVHLVLNRDASTRVVAPDETRGAKVWAGARVTWGGRLFGGTAP